MPLTFTSIASTAGRAEALIQSIHSWAKSYPVALDPSATMNLQLRALGSNIDSYLFELNEVLAAGDFSGLDGAVQADITALQGVVATASTTITATASPDAHFTALDSTDQDAVAAAAVAAGFAPTLLTTAEDTWNSINDVQKPDAIQYALVDSSTITSLLAALAVDYA